MIAVARGDQAGSRRSTRLEVCVPSCPSCRSSNRLLAERCSNCGASLSAASPAPSEPITPIMPIQPILEAELEPPRRRTWPLLLGAAGLAAGVAVLALWLASRGGAGAAATVPAPSAVAAQAAWSPPPGPRQDLIAIAQSFPGLDERSLGSLFDAKLRPLYGAANLFLTPVVQRIPRHDMRHSFEQLTDAIQLDLGFRQLMAGLGTSWNASHRYQLYRALQLAEVVTLDERQAMREPPAEAVFYLAEVRTGASYDMFVRDTQTSQRDFAGLDGFSIEQLQSQGRYQITQRGSGLAPTTGSAIFAMTPSQVASAYAASGTPVAIELVFRTIPTRTFERKKLPSPRVLVDAALALGEGEARYYTLVPGTVALRIASAPKGVVLTWDKPVQCSAPVDGPERLSFEAQCTLTQRTVLTVTNYTQQGRGPVEQVSVYLARLPQLP